MRKNLKNSVGLLVIIGIIIMPFSNFVPKAKAQWDLGSGTNVSYESSGGGSSGSGYMTGAVSLLGTLPGCKKAISNEIKNLFNPSSLSSPADLGVVVDPSTTGDASDPTMEGVTLDDYLTESTNEVNSVSVNDATANKINSETLAKVKATDKRMANMDINQNCFNAIGKAVVKLLIQRMTLSIVNWIQNGNEGNPFYPENMSKYFGDIAKTEILGFGLEINDSSKYPFGKAFMQSVASGFNNTFAANAEYSLDKMIKETNPEFSAVSFNADFSQGGWGAWEAMTQYPQNNPLGFQLMASNELGKRLEGTSQSAAQDVRDALNQADGALGEQRCTDPWNQSKEDSDAALVAGDTANVCKSWEYITPGAVVGHMLTKGIDDNDNSLLTAETLNDAIAAIIDAATQRLSKEITSGLGLAGATTDNTNYNQYNTSYGFTTSQVETDFSAYQIAASTWLKQNPYFNIRTDLNQALIDQQRTYVDKLAEQNEELMSKTGTGANYGLIPTIYQLDYCIPGPHPGFEQDSYGHLNTVLSKLSAVDTDTADKISSGAVTAGAALGAVAGSIIPGVGTAIGAAIGAVVGLITGWITSLTSGSEVQKYYAGLIASLTDLRPDPGTHTGSLQQVNNSMNVILERYINLIHQIFTDNPNMPSVTEEATNEFNKISGYQKMMGNNYEKITSMKNIITKLEGIKSEVDTLNGELAAGNLDQEQYEANLALYISSFGILSSELVSGDNVANVDSILKQIIDEKDYVYKDLLKGPASCEQDLVCANGGNACHMPWQVFDTKRMPFSNRLPILYDYNNYGAGAILPDPYNSGYTNKMPSGTAVNNVGPGFLSYARFWNNQDGFGGPIGNTIILPTGPRTGSQAVLSLFVDEYDTSATSVMLFSLTAGNTTIGKGPFCGSSSWGCSGVFESVIGIY